MASSLSTLSKNLNTPGFDKFRETSKHFARDDMEFVTRKGVYPYEYTDSWRKLDEATLSSKESFYSTLTEENIKDTEYRHAVKVWRHFDCKTLDEYSDLYLKIDILLLADVLENFRDICLTTYSLDAAYYYTAPGLSFDVCLKFTSIKLEFLSDYDMLLMCEKGNSLYGWAMSEYIPYGGFEWIEPTLDGLENLNDTSEIGRMYEVDIEYPLHLHDDHNDLPFLLNSGIPRGSKIRKLVATLESKERYIVHCRNLKQAMANGLKVKKVYRVLQFKQSKWLAKYINLNSGMRKKAMNQFEIDFYKLMNNSVFVMSLYRKMMRSRIKMELVSSEQRLQKLMNRSTFKYYTNYEHKNITAVTMDSKIINFYKPIYIGFAVLDISKTMMYDYHYNVMKAHYGDNIKLMYTDTDSLIYHINTTDFYVDLAANHNLLDRMDTANLPHDHSCYISDRKKHPGADEPNDVWSELDSEVDAEGVKWSEQDKDLMRALLHHTSNLTKPVHICVNLKIL
ncbi:hypothetical protein QTP88_028848 [Uroleucon formosanum]